MVKLFLTAATAVMLVLFIKDSPASKKIWTLITATASSAAMIYIVVVYYSFVQKLKK